VRAEDIRNQLTVSSNGELFPEDTVKVLPGYQRSPLTVFNATLDDLFRSQPWLDMTQAIQTPPEKCRSCDWVKICNGGRLHNRFRRDTGLNNPSVYCAGLQKYFEHVTATLVRAGKDLDAIHSALIG